MMRIINNVMWTYSDDFECWVYNDLPSRPPSKFTLGDRLVYWQEGRNTNNAVLRGSTKSHWGGWDFGYDLREAIEWLRQRQEREHYFLKDEVIGTVCG